MRKRTPVSSHHRSAYEKFFSGGGCSLCMVLLVYIQFQYSQISDGVQLYSLLAIQVPLMWNLLTCCETFRTEKQQPIHGIRCEIA